MQLKNQKNIRQLLAVATTSLLGGTAQQAVAADTADNKWEVDSAVLFYAEKDRVSVVEPVVSMKKLIGDDEIIKFQFVADSLTGASPNGAIPTSSPQTFTSPSGNSTYTTPASETPLDTTFRDARGAVSVEWEKPIDNYLKGVYSANFSKETDYASLGVGANLVWDVNQRNTSLTAGLAYSLDQVAPSGGAPLGFSAMPVTTSVDKTTYDGSTDKNIVSLLLGVTQVIGPKTLMQLNYTHAMEDGYLTDPYKILSVLDGSRNLRATDPYLYEHRPDSRTRDAIFWKTVHQFDEDVLQFSYRYYWDDWGITSHTLDVKYRYELNAKNYLEPHLRYYTQSKADFYNYNLVDGTVPQYASADYRLGDLETTTIGIKYGHLMDDNSEFAVRAEMIKQQPTGKASFLDTDVFLIQLNYSFLF